MRTFCFLLISTITSFTVIGQWVVLNESTKDYIFNTAQIFSVEDEDLFFGLMYEGDTWEWIIDLEYDTELKFSFDTKPFSKEWSKIVPNPEFDIVEHLSSSKEFLRQMLTHNELRITARLDGVITSYSFELKGLDVAIINLLSHDTFFLGAESIDRNKEYKETTPLFGGCKNKACSDEALMKYIHRNLRYPDAARDEGLEGRVFIRFIVETSGVVTNAEIVRDIGMGCGEEALRVIKNMNNLDPRWTPGKVAGLPFNVMYTIPATYKLNN